MDSKSCCRRAKCCALEWGALSEPRTWHNFPYGFGPNLNGLFSQSNFGIVTRMGFTLARKPEMQAQFTVSSRRSDDLHSLVATV